MYLQQTCSQGQTLMNQTGPPLGEGRVPLQILSNISHNQFEGLKYIEWLIISTKKLSQQWQRHISQKHTQQHDLYQSALLGGGWGGRERERGWEGKKDISLQQVFLTLNQHCQVQWDRTNILCQTNIQIFSQIHANIWFLWTHRQENVPGVLPNFPILFWIAFQIFCSERFWSVQTIPFFYNIHVNRHSLIPAFLTVDLFLTESHLECCLLLKRI